LLTQGKDDKPKRRKIWQDDECEKILNRLLGIVTIKRSHSSNDVDLFCCRVVTVSSVS